MSISNHWMIGGRLVGSADRHQFTLGPGKTEQICFGPNWIEQRRFWLNCCPHLRVPLCWKMGDDPIYAPQCRSYDHDHAKEAFWGYFQWHSAGYFLVSILCWWPFCAIYFTAWSNAEKYLGVKMLAGYSKCWPVIVTNFTGNHWPIKHFWDQEEAEVKK